MNAHLRLAMIAIAALLSTTIAWAETVPSTTAPKAGLDAKPEPKTDAKPACAPDALGTSRTLAVGTKGGPEVGLKSYSGTLPLADHEVVLTFDDGPGMTTPSVLVALAHECVEGTFFLVGRNAEAEPAVVKRELAEGHTLGHHTYSHPARTLRRMSEADAEADIERGFKADDLAAYGTAGDRPRVPFFRFPGFADTPALDTWLGKRDIGVFGTDIWALDWLLLTPQAELSYIMRQLEKTHRGIILLHDTRLSTAKMLPDLLRALKVGGYRVVHIVPGPGTAATTPAVEGWSSETDRIIAEVFSHGSFAGRRRFSRGGGRRPRRVAVFRYNATGPRFSRLGAMRKHRRFGATKGG